ncbi:MAG TPA: metalloregulator ArsR/SmtB family transcription factor [Actinomycetes bacterium]|jgi:DNA-binding transcriptional ArsR family regulator|nr:metalloregulator ArsR/SmtB family transcription factor [Actinomycetes bacterium]
MNGKQAAAADPFTAIAHPIRRDLLGRLALGECSVGELAGPFQVTRPAVSQHLRVLLDAGLVRERRDGRERRYRLDPERLAVVRRWLATFDRFWRERLVALGDYLDEHEREGR